MHLPKVCLEKKLCVVFKMLLFHVYGAMILLCSNRDNLPAGLWIIDLNGRLIIVYTVHVVNANFVLCGICNCEVKCM
jgi:hypothetical protein